MTCLLYKKNWGGNPVTEPAWVKTVGFNATLLEEKIASCCLKLSSSQGSRLRDSASLKFKTGVV